MTRLQEQEERIELSICPKKSIKRAFLRSSQITEVNYLEIELKNNIDNCILLLLLLGDARISKIELHRLIPFMQALD